MAELGHKNGPAAHNLGASQMREPKPFTLFRPVHAARRFTRWYLPKTDNLGGRLRLYVEAIFHNA